MDRMGATTAHPLAVEWSCQFRTVADVEDVRNLVRKAQIVDDLAVTVKYDLRGDTFAGFTARTIEIHATGPAADAVRELVGRWAAEHAHEILPGDDDA